MNHHVVVLIACENGEKNVLEIGLKVKSQKLAIHVKKMTAKEIFVLMDL